MLDVVTCVERRLRVPSYKLFVMQAGIFPDSAPRPEINRTLSYVDYVILRSIIQMRRVYVLAVVSLHARLALPMDFFLYDTLIRV